MTTWTYIGITIGVVWYLAWLYHGAPKFFRVGLNFGPFLIFGRDKPKPDWYYCGAANCHGHSAMPGVTVRCPTEEN